MPLRLFGKALAGFQKPWQIFKSLGRFSKVLADFQM
jgi:hypothetical protein